MLTLVVNNLQSSTKIENTIKELKTFSFTPHNTFQYLTDTNWLEAYVELGL